jgi:hypothetical protein
MLQADDNRCDGLQVLDDENKELKLRRLFFLLYFRQNFLAVVLSVAVDVAVDAVMTVGCSDWSIFVRDETDYFFDTSFDPAKSNQRQSLSDIVRLRR